MDLIRALIYIFFPDRCWECFALDSCRQLYSYSDESWGVVEAEWGCHQCGTKMAEMHYSPVYPNHPKTIPGRIRFLQDELNYPHGYVLRGNP